MTNTAMTNTATPTPDRSAARRFRSDHGQATTEYALILLAVALVGLLVVAWATAGGAAGRIGQLFDQVVDSVISRL
jgi:Flp pilus assembly pilin Flp